MEVQKQGAGAVVQPPTAGSRRALTLPGQLKASLATSADGLLATFDAILQQITPVEPLKPNSGNGTGGANANTLNAQQTEASAVPEGSTGQDDHADDEAHTDSAVAVDASQTVADTFVGVDDSDLNAPVVEEQLQLDVEDEDDELNAAEIVALVDPVETQVAVEPTDEGLEVAEEVAVIQQADHEEHRVRGRRRGEDGDDAGVPSSEESTKRPLKAVGEESNLAGSDTESDAKLTESQAKADTEELGWSSVSNEREGREPRVRRHERQADDRNQDVGPENSSGQRSGESSTTTGRDGISIEGLEPVAPEPFSAGTSDQSASTQAASPLSVETASVVTAAVRSAAQATSSENVAAPARAGVGAESGTAAIDGPRATGMLSESDKKSPAGGTSATDNAERVKLVQRVARSFQRLGATGGQINMMLHPAELGSVRLNLKVEGKHMDATITTETSEALEVLRENLPELRQRLADLGIEIDRIEFEVQRDERAHRDFEGFGRQGDSQYQPQWQSGQHRRDPAASRSESVNTGSGAVRANRQDSEVGGVRLRGLPVMSGLDLRG